MIDHWEDGPRRRPQTVFTARLVLVTNMYYGSHWMIDSFRILSSPEVHRYQSRTQTGSKMIFTVSIVKADFSSWPRIGRVAASNEQLNSIHVASFNWEVVRSSTRVGVGYTPSPALCLCSSTGLRMPSSTVLSVRVVVCSSLAPGSRITWLGSIDLQCTVLVLSLFHERFLDSHLSGRSMPSGVGGCVPDVVFPASVTDVGVIVFTDSKPL